ncbi:MAG: mechanosensitive ion channel family protein, partial [Roseicyclus sp.]
MDPDISPDVVEQALTLLDYLRLQVETFAATLVRPWNAYQLAMVAALAAITWLVHRRAAPALPGWMRSRQDWPRWRLRALVVLHRRLGTVIFVVLIWTLVTVMRELTWPSRSYLMAIVANLATAWLLIAVATRLIRNPILRLAVRYGVAIWVALRILQLDDAARDLLDGIALNLGEMRLSLWAIVQAAVLIGLFIVLARLVARTTTTRIERNEDVSPSMRVLTVKLVQVVLYGSAIFLGLRAVGVDLTGLAVLSGAIGLGLGFGLQKVVSNLVSGIIILLDKSIKPGDVISLGETFGWIQSLGARYVSVVTRDGREYLIPNEDLITGQVVNWSHSDRFVRLDIHFGTAYSDDPHMVRRVAVEAATGVDRVLSERRPVCHITGFGDSSVNYILRFWITDPTDGLTNIRGNVYLALWDAFREHGISIPFPQREVKLL